MDSTQPITGAEYEHLVAELCNAHAADLSPISEDKFVDFILCTGMHPHALAHPEIHRIRLTEDGISWKRPKTRATVTVPVHDRLKPWVKEFIELLRESHQDKTELKTFKRKKTGQEYQKEVITGCAGRLNLNRLIHHWGQAHGMPELTPRGLRHTFAYRVWEATGHDLNAAKALAGTTERVLLNYARVKKQSWEGKLPNSW
jgi:integrase